MEQDQQHPCQGIGGDPERKEQRKQQQECNERDRTDLKSCTFQCGFHGAGQCGNKFTEVKHEDLSADFPEDRTAADQVIALFFRCCDSHLPHVCVLVRIRIFFLQHQQLMTEIL